MITCLSLGSVLISVGLKKKKFIGKRVFIGKLSHFVSHLITYKTSVVSPRGPIHWYCTSYTFSRYVYFVLHSNKANKFSLIYGIFMLLYSWLNRCNLIFFFWPVVLSYQIIYELLCNSAIFFPPINAKWKMVQLLFCWAFLLSRNMNFSK